MKATFVFAVTALAIDGRAQSPVYTIYGHASDDNAGYSVASAGDVNADGFADFIIGAPRCLEAEALFTCDVFPQKGLARIYSGRSGGLLFELEGDSRSRFGASVASVGDVNFDGRDDVVVGAPYTSVGNTWYFGRIHVFSGIDGSLLWTADGDDDDDLLGFAVDGAGDVNADGVPDVIAGAPGVGNGGNYARVYSGVDGSVLRGLSGSGRFGWSVSGLGLVDADFHADFAVGAPLRDVFPVGVDRGQVRVYSGIDGSVLFDLRGTHNRDQLGTSVDGVGDVDHDGTPDFVAGAPYGGAPGFGPGLARVYSGVDGSTIVDFVGTSGERTGAVVGGVGDVNGDGTGDVIVVTPDADPRVRVFSVATGATLFDIPTSGPSCASGVGDVNGDGTPDFAIGRHDADFASPVMTSVRAGRVDVFSSGYDPPGTPTCPGDSTGGTCPCGSPPVTVFEESFSAGTLPPGWTASNLCHVTDQCAGGPCLSGPFAYFGVDAFCNYDVSLPIEGGLWTPIIQLPPMTQGVVYRLSWCQVLSFELGFDVPVVQLSGSAGNVLYGIPATPSDRLEIDISSYAGGTLTVIWSFRVDDELHNDFLGWQIDDVRIEALPNFGHPGEGCRNALGAGARLTASGTSSVTADDLQLVASQVPRFQQGLFFMGDVLSPGVPVGGGVACAGGSSFRFPGTATDSAGIATLGSPIAASPGLIQPGATFHFQFWYRDTTPANPCGSGNNLSNAYSVVFRP